MMKLDPSLIQRNEQQIGQELLSVFQDDNFSDAFQNLKSLKKDILSQVVEDIASGGKRLNENSFGVTFKTGKLETFVIPLGSLPEGNVVFSVSQKSRAAFMNWRNKNEDELSQEAINSSIYYLAIAWSQLL